MENDNPSIFLANSHNLCGTNLRNEYTLTKTREQDAWEMFAYWSEWVFIRRK